MQIPAALRGRPQHERGNRPLYRKQDCGQSEAERGLLFPRKPTNRPVAILVRKKCPFKKYVPRVISRCLYGGQNFGGGSTGDRGRVRVFLLLFLRVLLFPF